MPSAIRHLSSNHRLRPCHFDLTADRAETHNLAAAANQAKTLASLRSRFAELKAAAK